MRLILRVKYMLNVNYMLHRISEIVTIMKLHLDGEVLFSGQDLAQKSLVRIYFKNSNVKIVNNMGHIDC